MSFVYILVFSGMVILIGNFKLFVKGCTEILDIKVNSDFVQLGSNATLLCSVENFDSSHQTLKWTSGKNDKLLTFDTSSINSKKFQPTANHLGFGLIIYNITTQDVNIIYTCSCGFAKKTITLQLTERRKPHNDATTLINTSETVILVMFALFACGLLSLN